MNLSHSLSHMFPIRVGHSRHFCMRLEACIHLEFDICRLQGRDLSPTHSVALLTYLADMEQQLCPRGLCVSLSPFKVSDSWVRWRSGPAAAAVHPPEDWGKWELAWVPLCSRAFARGFHCAPLYVPLPFPTLNLWAWNPTIDIKAWTSLGAGPIWPIIPTTWEDEAWVPG